MNYKLTNRIFAAVVFLISAVQFFLTAQPSVSFWDCGEFTAAAYYLQVPHPPGSPLFTLLGRIFAMIPFASNIAFRVNTISVLASAGSVLFLYLIAVKLIENYKNRQKPISKLDAISTYLAAAIGALSFSFSDTFWFNGVEAEVYATSTFLFSVITFFMVLWHFKADNKDNEKYILMIAYLIGLSTGVHLMSVLAMVSVVMMIIFTKYVEDEKALKTSGLIFLGHAAVILIVAFILWAYQTGKTPPSPEQYRDFDSKFKLAMGGISVLIMGVFWKKIFNKNSIYIPFIIGGIALFLTYPGVVKILPGILTSVAADNVFTALILLVILLGILGFAVKYAVDNKKPTLHLAAMSFIFIILGFTTYTMIIIRANQNPPMNENEPNDFHELVSYLNREQYGDFPIFKRRFATEPHQMGVYSNYSSDLDFFWTYQMNHMMTRYWLWNYAGRSSWEQDAPADIAPFNGVGDFFGKFFGLRFEGAAHDSLFAVPFLLGLIGIYFQFKKDWKMAAIFMVLFIFMGYLTAFYQNQQQPQPRERDYFYVGAFFVFSIWIAFGIRGLIDLVQEKIAGVSARKAVTVAILVLGVVLVPITMLKANYFTHDRSKNWVPWDYSYNLLQSCATNAILFTNGDNDTFPLWYLQDVEGVRRDVKIVNLSLLNTDWYIKQLKNNDPYNVGTVAIRMTNQQIEQLQPIQWEPQDVVISTDPSKTGLPSDVYQSYNLEDSSVIKSGQLKFRMNNTLTYGNIKAIRVQDIMVKEIVEANNWKRPIYFAVTCSEDSKIGLSNYLRMEGMTLRLVPEKRTPGIEFVNAPVLRKELYNENPSFSKDYEPGYKFRGLNNPDIFFDENHIRMVQNYRNAFLRLSIYYVNIKQNEKAIATLNLMDEKIPRKVIPMENGLLFEIGNIYYNAGAMNIYKKIAAEVEQSALQDLENNPNNVQSYYNPYRILLDTYENLKDYEKLVGIWEKIQEMYPNDPNVKANIEKYKNLAKKDNLSVEKDSAKLMKKDTSK